MKADRFILNAARINLSEQNISVLKEISNNGMDWDSFEKTALKHGVSPFIYYSLTNNGLTEIIPKEICNKLKAEYYRVAINNSILLDGFSKLSKIITNKIILLKGIELIQSLYPNIAIRTMGDIDILVEKECVLDNWNSLLHSKLECHSSGGKSKLHLAQSLETGRHLPPIDAKRFWVEIHWNIFGERRLYEITKTAWVKPILSKNNIYRLSNEVMLIHLCSHFYKHLQSFAILRMLCDINEFIIKYKNIIDWGEIDRICNNPKLKNEIDIALTYSKVLFDTQIPHTFVSNKIVNNSRITISSLCIGNIVSEKSSLSDFYEYLINFGNFIDKMVFLFRTFVPVKAWMGERFDVTTQKKLIKAYLKFWQYLIIKWILKKDIKYA